MVRRSKKKSKKKVGNKSIWNMSNNEAKNYWKQYYNKQPNNRRRRNSIKKMFRPVSNRTRRNNSFYSVFSYKNNKSKKKKKNPELNPEQIRRVKSYYNYKDSRDLKLALNSVRKLPLNKREKRIAELTQNKNYLNNFKNNNNNMIKAMRNFKL